jgi:membrane protein YdbS with pleckstrin-like domain
MGKDFTQRVFDSFPDGKSMPEAKEYSDKVYQAWKDISASLSRSALLIFLLIAIFELLVYQHPATIVSIGTFTFFNAPIVQIALPAVIAFFLYDGYRLSVRWLHLQFAYLTLTRMLTPLQRDNDLDLLITPSLPSLWGIGTVLSPRNADISDIFISRVNDTLMYTMMLVVPISFECQAYYRLVQKFGYGNIFLWIGLVITVLLNISTALYVLLGMFEPRIERRDHPVSSQGGCE